MAGKGTPGWDEARGQLFAVLKASGIGAEVETRAIEAYRAGDPAALTAGGASRSWPDGTHISYTPGQPAIVSHGKASQQQLSAAPALPQADSPRALHSPSRHGGVFPISRCRACRVSTTRRTSADRREALPPAHRGEGPLQH
jgi:hypothetical protein